MAASRGAVPPLLAKLPILMFLLIPVCGGVPGRRVRRQGIIDNVFYTSVCEGSAMDLRCQPGLVIYIEEANFGRVDDLTCVTGPVRTIDCTSYDKSKEIVSQRCNGKKTCSIPTTTETFGDPCPGTAKYLEVIFECLTAPTTPVPPTTTRPPTTPRLGTDGGPTLGTELPGDSTTIPDDMTTTATTTTVPSTTVATTTHKPEFCLPEVKRGVQWRHAPAGTTDVQACPGNHTGQAMWHCGGSPARWMPESGPDLSGCVSPKLKNITAQLETGVSTTVISEELANTVESEEELLGGDIVAVTDILTASLENLDEELENATQEEKSEKTQEVTKNYLKVGSTILEDENLDSWDGIPDEKRTETASTLITSLEESAFLLADNLDGEQTVVEEEDNVVMEVVVRNTEDLPDTDLVFPDTDQLSGDWRGVTDSITLPADSIKERSKDGKTKIVMLAYNNIGQFLGTDKDDKVVRPPSSTPKAERQTDQRPCSREPKIYQDMGDVVNSRVLSVSINDPWQSTPLSKPVNLTFEHQIVGDNLTDPVCSFWRFDNNTGGFLSGEWSDRGCVMVHNNETHTVCSCDHLTNFAIIMNVKGPPIERGHAFALSFITYFGFIVSVPCLVLALITFCMFKNLQSDRTTIHKNLCFTLILAEIIFMAGIGQTSNQVLCGVVALLLHYLFLSAFAWMCLEGIQLYIMLVEVFEAESSRRKYYYPFGYVLPLIIVAISAAIDFDSYGTPDHCWICTEGNFVWSFAAPVCLIIFGNILFLSMALFIMCRHSTLQTNPKEKTPKEKITTRYRRLMGSISSFRRSSSVITSRGARRASNEVEVAPDPYDLPSGSSDRLTSLVRGALVLLCLLGITWAFGLLYVSENLIAFAYIFTITNAFQGLFIYIFHCCMNDKVLKEYRRYIRNSTWLPDCIREQYGGTVLTNSHPQNSYRSSSALKRPDSKRFSNTTGSYSVDQRKMSSSSVFRNSVIPPPVQSDECIGLTFTSPISPESSC